jgi:hypothetical protein
MNYIAQLIFKIEMPDQKYSQFDCQVRMIEAENEEKAFFIAKGIGLTESSQFINSKGGLVRWEFVGITSIQEWNNSENGSMLFSNTIETEPNDEFSNYVEIKTKDLALALRKKELIFSH